jgi:hypothetical protein
VHCPATLPGFSTCLCLVPGQLTGITVAQVSMSSRGSSSNAIC